MVIPAKHEMPIVFLTSLHPNPTTFSLILTCFVQPKRIGGMDIVIWYHIKARLISFRTNINPYCFDIIFNKSHLFL